MFCLKTCKNIKKSPLVALNVSFCSAISPLRKEIQERDQGNGGRGVALWEVRYNTHTACHKDTRDNQSISDSNTKDFEFSNVNNSEIVGTRLMFKKVKPLLWQVNRSLPISSLFLLCLSVSQALWSFSFTEGNLTRVWASHAFVSEVFLTWGGKYARTRKTLNVYSGKLFKPLIRHDGLNICMLCTVNMFSSLGQIYLKYTSIYARYVPSLAARQRGSANVKESDVFFFFLNEAKHYKYKAISSMIRAGFILHSKSHVLFSFIWETKPASIACSDSVPVLLWCEFTGMFRQGKKWNLKEGYWRSERPWMLDHISYKGTRNHLKFYTEVRQTFYVT